MPEGAPGRVRYESWKKESPTANEDAFHVLIARELYPVTAAYREFAPAKLLFSERDNTIPGAPLEIIAEADKLVDVISFQPYEKTVKGDILDQVNAMTGKPIIRSDWSLSFPVEGHTNTMRSQFPTPAAAATAYEAYLSSAFAKPYILGYHACQYATPSSPSANSNKAFARSTATCVGTGPKGTSRFIQGCSKTLKNRGRERKGSHHEIRTHAHRCHAARTAHRAEANQTALKAAYDQAAAR